MTTEGMDNQLRLSDEQIAAVGCDDSAIVVTASAGSGKTEVVAHRIERLLSASAGQSFRVLALSYTQKAANKLQERLQDHLGSQIDRIHAHTFHSFAHATLRSHGTRIGLPLEPEVLTRDEDRSELLARWLEAEGKALPTEVGQLFRDLDLARAQLRNTDYLPEWEAALADSGAVDYPAMLTRATELLSMSSTQRQMRRTYGQVVVDEAQNMTGAQYELLTRLIGLADSKPAVSTMIVGDDKQSIVSFAGADPAYMSRFKEDFDARTFSLNTNYRSAEAIAELGNRIAVHLDNGEPNEVDAAPAGYAAKGLVETVVTSSEQVEGETVASWAQTLLTDGLPPDTLSRRAQHR